MRISYIELAGERHPLCFSLTAIEEISSEWGDMDGMSKAISDTENLARKLNAINKLLEILIAAGRRYGETVGMELPPKLKCRPGDLIDITDSDTLGKIFAVVKNDAERDVEAVSKNA